MKTNKRSTDNAERILSEAWGMFQQKGFRGTSIDELCQRCGITKPTLYYYFLNKEALYVQVLIRQLVGYRSLLQHSAPLHERLVQLAQMILQQHDINIVAMLRDMEHVQDQTYHHMAHNAFNRELLDPLVAMMEQGIDEGALRCGDSAFLAWSFLGLVNTFVGRFNDQESQRAQVAEHITNLFLYGATHTTTGG